ncbi:acetoacetyl-CoA reductase [Stappia sp.]|uniref:acetoacetyl-CoA reductase n=1 Tax=Stappia sp. TaxID=1870903 RepID=UPI003A98DB0F
MSNVAIVTGGTRGIGAAISKGLKDAGYTGAAPCAGHAAGGEAPEGEAGRHVYKWDVADAAACQDGVTQVVSDLGAVSVLVNNAGITRDGWFHKMDYEQWSAVIRTNLDSMFTMTRPVIDGMRERGHGRIVNISSINGQKGQLGQTNYSAAKAGVIGFTKALASENARKGITVNAICPGYIDTDMVAAVPEKVLEGIIAGIPVGRLGQAEEIAAAVAYLASKQAAFMTGAVLTINGGQYYANG